MYIPDVAFSSSSLAYTQLNLIHIYYTGLHPIVTGSGDILLT